ncbi:MAG: monooxygenase FAD-binding protein [Frankiales bacterium]|nr:monooxygenase FAD-binding protein [Frankiales bacterium]
MYDVAVIGAGPAGAAAALSALRTKPGCRVLLVDKADFPRDKSCGDGIAPHALDELARLGVADVLLDQTPVRRLRLVSPRGTEAVADVQRPNYVLPRTVFDARLVQAAVARGAELRRQTVRSLDELDARVVIGADGANGVTRRLLGLPKPDEQTVAVAVRGYIAWETSDPEQLIIMDGRDWPAYAWRFDTGRGTANVGFGMLLPNLRATPRGKDALHERLVELVPEAAGAERLRSHHLPLTTGRPAQPDGRVLLAGDAASLVNPLTGEGIYYALLSGRLAGAAAVGDGDPGSAYRLALHQELGRHLAHTTALARLTAHQRVLDAGVRAVRDRPEAMYALVEVGLGRGLITPTLVRALGAEAARSVARRWPHP